MAPSPPSSKPDDHTEFNATGAWRQALPALRLSGQTAAASTAAIRRQTSFEASARLGGALSAWWGAARRSSEARRREREPASAFIDRPYEALQPRGTIPCSYAHDLLTDDGGARSDDAARLRKPHWDAARLRKPHWGDAVTAVAIARCVSTRASSDRCVAAEYVLSGGACGSLTMHCMATGREVCALRSAHGKSAILCLAVTPCGTQALSGGMDGALRRWQLDERRGLAHVGEADYRLHAATPITALAVQPESARWTCAREGTVLLLTAGRDGRLALSRLDARRAQPLRLVDAVQLAPTRALIRGLAFVPPPRGQTALSAGESEGELARALAVDSHGTVASWTLDLRGLSTRLLAPAEEAAAAEAAALARARAADGRARGPSDDASAEPPPTTARRMSSGESRAATDEPLAHCFVSSHVVARFRGRRGGVSAEALQQEALFADERADERSLGLGGGRGAGVMLPGGCALAVTPGGSRVFTCGDDGRIVRWGLERVGAPVASDTHRARDAAREDAGAVRFEMRLVDQLDAARARALEPAPREPEGAPPGLFAIGLSFDGAALVAGGSEGTLRRYASGTMVCEVAMAPRASENEVGLEAGRLFASRGPANSRSSVSDPAHSYGRAGTTLSCSPERPIRHAGALGRMAERGTLRAAVEHERARTLPTDHGSVLQLALQPRHHARAAPPPPSDDGLQVLASCGSDGLLRLWLAARRPQSRQPSLVLLCAVPNLVGSWGLGGAQVRGSVAAVAASAAPDADGGHPSHPQRSPPPHAPRPRAESGRRPRDGIAARGLCFGPSGRKLFAADIAGRLARWDVAEMRAGTLAATAPRPELFVAAAHGRTGDGRAIASLALALHEAGWGAEAADGGGRARDDEDGGAVLVSACEEAEPAPAGGSAGGLLRFFSTELRAIPAAVEPPLRASLHCIAFTRDGRTLLGAGPGRACDISLWQVEFVRRDAGLRCVLSHHRVCENAHGGAPVRCLAASPDDRRVVSGGADGCARLWILHLAARDGAAAGAAPALNTLVAIGDAIEAAHGTLEVNALAFAADGSTLFTGGGDGALRSWPAEWCLRAEGKVRRFEPPLLLASSPADAAGAAHARASAATWADVRGAPTRSDSSGSGASARGGRAGLPSFAPVSETLYLGEDALGQRGDALPLISRAALELAFGARAVGGWCRDDERELVDAQHAISDAQHEAADADDRACAPFAPGHSTDGFWHEMALLWPTRLAANAHLLVLKAVASANHAALRQLLHVSAACDWGHPFAVLTMRLDDELGAHVAHEFSALHLAIARADAKSVRLLLRYMVQLKGKSHALSSVLHATDLLLLNARYPYMLAQFLTALGLERVHPAISASCETARVRESLAWCTRMLRAASPAFDAVASRLGCWPHVPTGSFVTRAHVDMDPPRAIWREMVAHSSDEKTAATVALRVGVKDALACRELLPLLVHSSAAAQLLHTPIAIALIDAKWHSYAARVWMVEAAVLCVYTLASLVFLLFLSFDDDDVLALVGGGQLELHHVAQIVGFAAKLIVVINSSFVVRELFTWRLATRATGSSRSYLLDLWNVFDWALIVSSTIASCVFLRCAQKTPTPSERLQGIAVEDRPRCTSAHNRITSDWAALATLALAFRVLGQCRALPNMAAIINAITRVCRELFHFMCVMLVTILAFGLALYVRLSNRSRKWWQDPDKARQCEWEVARGGEPRCELIDRYSSFTSVLVSAWAIMLGDFDTDTFQEQAVDVVIFIGFTFLISVLMLNQIIAVISEHHSRISSLRVRAWRESLASTICDVDLLLYWWCSTTAPWSTSDERCGGRRAHLGAASRSELAWLARKRRWKRLPIDSGAPGAREVEVGCESNTPVLALSFSALGGAAVGSALGSFVGRHVGARSTGASIAIPAGAIATAVLRTATFQCGRAFAALASRSARTRLAVDDVDDDREHASSRAHVASDCVILLASVASLSGALLSFDMAEALGSSVHAVVGAGLLTGVAFAVLFLALFVGLRVSARALFTACVLYAELTMLTCAAVTAGACVAFVVPGEMSERVSTGAYVGGVASLVLYACSWMGSICATASAFLWLWLPRAQMAASVVCAAGTCAVFVMLSELAARACAPHTAAALLPDPRRPEPDCGGARAAQPAADEPSALAAEAAEERAPGRERHALGRLLALVSDGCLRTLETVHAARSGLRSVAAAQCATAAGCTAAAHLCAPRLAAVYDIDERDEAFAPLRVLLGSFAVVCCFLGVEMLRAPVDRCHAWRSSRASGARAYVRMPEPGAADAEALAGGKGRCAASAARVRDEGGRQLTPVNEPLRWVHVLTTQPTSLLGGGGLPLRGSSSASSCDDNDDA